MVLNQASNIMFGNQEVRKVYLGKTLVWERKKNYDTAKINVIKLDDKYQETKDIQYFDTVAEIKNILDANKENLYKVVIGARSCITGIQKNEIYNCPNLREIEIPSTVTVISDGAFAGTGLFSVTIPDSVTSIGIGVFAACADLTSVTLSNKITTIPAIMFGTCTNLTSVTIPESVTSIGFSAFVDCTSLTSINIPASVTSISSDSFRNCINLRKITVHQAENSISGAPWGAPNAEIVWTG